MHNPWFMELYSKSKMVSGMAFGGIMMELWYLTNQIWDI